MYTIRIAGLALAGAMILMGASECNINGKPDNETCSITARDTTTITMSCSDSEGNTTKRTENIPSDLYPGCQVGTYWEGCKRA